MRLETGDAATGSAGVAAPIPRLTTVGQSIKLHALEDLSIEVGEARTFLGHLALETVMLRQRRFCYDQFVCTMGLFHHGFASLGLV